MYCVRKITEDIYFVGGSDRRLSLFENMYPIPNGVTYNAYFIDDAKTAVVDTVDKAVGDLFFENVEHLLGGRALDYVVVNHMEPDHCATLGALCEKHPETKIICSAKAAGLIAQFFKADLEDRIEQKKEEQKNA